MNYLAHLYFSDLTPNSCVGQLLPDCMPIRRLPADAPQELLDFAHLHQHIDRFTDHHPEVVALRHSFAPPYRRFAGVLIDVFFDHELANRWTAHHHQPLPEFAQAVYSALRGYTGPENERLRALRLAMIEHQWLPNYATRTGMNRALKSLDRRSRFTTPLGQAVDLLETHRAQITDTFSRFFPDLRASIQARKPFSNA